MLAGHGRMGRVSEQPGRYQRSPGGLIGAMVVLLVVVAGFVSFRALVRDEVEVPTKTVQYQQTVDYARTQVDFPLLAPEELPAGWRATSADFVPDPPRWSLGLLTDEDRYVGLAQSVRSEQNMVETYVDRDAVAGRSVEIDGQTWRSWSDEGGDTALTRDEEEMTVLVVSPAGLEVLIEFVETLSADG